MDVKSGSKSSIIAIIISKSKEFTTIITWDIKKDIEKNIYDVRDEYEIIWDQNGIPVII